MAERRSSVAVNLSLAVCAAAITLLGLEGALRGYHALAWAVRESPAPAARTDGGAIPLHIPLDSGVVYGLNPDHPEVNSLGVRGDEIAQRKPAGTTRVLILGDSVTYGHEVTREEAYPSVLQGRLRREGREIEVINAGVSGYTAYNELHAYLEQGREFEPDIVVVAFCMNDIANPRLHWGYTLEDIAVPAAAIPKPRYDRNDVRLRLERERRGERPAVLGSMLLAAIRERLRSVPTRITGEDDLSIEVLLDPDSPEWQWLTAIYQELRSAVEADGAELVILLLPLSYQLDSDYPFLPQSRIAEHCRSEDLRCLDPLSALREHAASELFLLDRFGRRDIWHLTTFGHQVVAEPLGDYLIAEMLAPADRPSPPRRPGP